MIEIESVCGFIDDRVEWASDEFEALSEADLRGVCDLIDACDEFPVGREFASSCDS